MNIPVLSPNARWVCDRFEKRTTAELEAWLCKGIYETVFLDEYPWKAFTDTACVISVDSDWREDIAGLYLNMAGPAQERFRQALTSVITSTALEGPKPRQISGMISHKEQFYNNCLSLAHRGRMQLSGATLLHIIKMACPESRSTFDATLIAWRIILPTDGGMLYANEAMRDPRTTGTHILVLLMGMHLLEPATSAERLKSVLPEVLAQFAEVQNVERRMRLQRRLREIVPAEKRNLFNGMEQQDLFGR